MIVVRPSLRNGSATLMRGKSTTCRQGRQFVSGSPTRGHRPRTQGKAFAASRRLAAHQSGRAIGIGRTGLNLPTAAKPDTDPFQPVQQSTYPDRLHNLHAGTAGNP